MSTTTTAAPQSRRSNPGLELLDLMAGPPGIDGYLEQISPMMVTGECRAQVARRRARHRGERHPDPAPEPRLGRPPRRPVRPGLGRDRRRPPHALLLARLRRGPPAASWRSRSSATPSGLVSNFLADHARPGMVLGLSQADGDFQLPDPRPDSILLIGAGSGITPLMGILRTLCAEGHSGPIALLQYAPDPERTIYREELDRLAAENPNFKLIRSYTRAPGAGELDGHFSPAHLPQADPRFDAAETFACGPPALLDAVRAAWAANGLEHRLHVESFVPPSLLPVGEPGEGTIRFAGSDVEVHNSGAPVLDPGRGGRRPGAVGLPHGDLPLLHLPQGERHRQEPAHRRGLLGPRRVDPALRLGAPQRPRHRPLNLEPTFDERHSKMSTKTENPTDLTPEQIESFGEELDAIRQRVLADRGERDANYIRRVIRAQRGLEVAGRGLLWAGVFPPAWIAGTTALSLSKILDNMEIGHNVMHGQYDWTNDPALSGKKFEWDNACPADQWRHSHNYMHHTHTNIVGKDRDIGYGVLRMSEDQRWTPYYLGQPALRDPARAALPVRGRGPRPRSRADPDRQGGHGRQAQDGEGDLEEDPPPEPQGLRRLPGALGPVLPLPAGRQR